MHLLERKQIDTLKADERKRDIDEGAKLAKKIDDLRRLASEEQTRLQKFRDESLKATRDEIDAVIREKENICREIESLRQEATRLKKVLEETADSITNLTHTT